MDNSKAYYAFERPGWTKFQTFPENPIPGALLRPGSNFVCRTYRGGGAAGRRGDRGREEGAWGLRHHRGLGAQVRKYFLLRPLIIECLKRPRGRKYSPNKPILRFAAFYCSWRQQTNINTNLQIQLQYNPVSAWNGPEGESTRQMNQYWDFQPFIAVEDNKKTSI